MRVIRVRLYHVTSASNRAARSASNRAAAQRAPVTRIRTVVSAPTPVTVPLSRDKLFLYIYAILAVWNRLPEHVQFTPSACLMASLYFSLELHRILFK